MPIDLVLTQQLAALVAVVSVAILGVVFLLFPSVWRGVKSSSTCLGINQKRLIYRNLLLYFIPFVIALLIIDFFGVYIPPLVVPVIKILLFALLAIWTITNITYRLIERRSKTKPMKIEEIPFSYRNTLFWLGLCIGFCLLALVSVVYPMLNINIGPATQDNYNWARWFLANGITSFIISIASFAITILIIRYRNRKTDEYLPPKKRSGIRWLPVLISLVLIILMSTLFRPKGYGLADFFSWPLNVEGNIQFTGTQFVISNESNFNWKDITCSINKVGLSSGYSIEIPQLNQEETVLVNANEFTNNEGVRFDLDIIKPTIISIEMRTASGRAGNGYITSKLPESSYSIRTSNQSIPLDIKTSLHFTGTQFTITNLNDFDWSDTTFSINEHVSTSGYYYEVSSLLKGGTLTINAYDFVNDEGLMFNPATIKPIRFTIKTQNDLGQSGLYTGTLQSSSP